MKATYSLEIARTVHAGEQNAPVQITISDKI